MLWYDGTIMMARTQITLQSQTHRQARQRAADLGISLAEYVRQLVAHDLSSRHASAEVKQVFDLGRSLGSNIAKDKDAMLGEAFSAGRRRVVHKTSGSKA
jgi:hypothetical protein